MWAAAQCMCVCVCVQQRQNLVGMKMCRNKPSHRSVGELSSKATNWCVHFMYMIVEMYLDVV